MHPVSEWVMEYVSFSLRYSSYKREGNGAPFSTCSQADLCPHSAIFSLKSLMEMLSWTWRGMLASGSLYLPLTLLLFYWQPSSYTNMLNSCPWKPPKRSTHPSLCIVICRAAFVRQNTTRTEARSTCVGCVRSQGRQRRHRCSGTWWSQNCPWSKNRERWRHVAVGQ